MAKTSAFLEKQNHGGHLHSVHGRRLHPTLNDSDIMEKDVFGKKRVEKVMAGVMEKFDYYKRALDYGKTKQERIEKSPSSIRKRWIRRFAGYSATRGL